MSARNRVFVSLLAVCTLLSVGLSHNVSAAPKRPLALARTYTSYLAIVVKATNAPPYVPTTPSPTPPPTTADGTFFMEPDKKTASPNMLSDAQGGLHLAYEYYVPENDHPDIVYTYCPPPATQCVTASAWGRVILPGPVEAVQLQLTPAGQPRILAEHSTLEGAQQLMNYTYAECDTGCLEAANWHMGQITAARLSHDLPVESRELTRRSFALDNNGHPHFVFQDFNTGDDFRLGGYYYSCDTNCADAANWTGTRFTHADPDDTYSYELIAAPVLKFTHQNQPRVLTEFYPLNNNDAPIQITYFACDSGCDDDANWGRVGLTPRGQGPRPAWDLEFDANDHPRAVVYHEQTPGEPTDNQLFYYQCDANCLDLSAWTPVNFNPAVPKGVGQGADLTLDAQGNPRIASMDDNAGLAYSWCNAQCTQPSSWTHVVGEESADLDAAYPVTIPTSCTGGVWFTYGPTLTLDPNGDPRIAYNATYNARCPNTPVPGEPPTYSFKEIVDSVRVFLSPQPTS